MKKNKMQCKDIPTKPILEFLNRNPSALHGWMPESERNICQAFPENTPPKLLLAKMKNLILRGLVKGCYCGCRGDFEISFKGQKYIELGELE